MQLDFKYLRLIALHLVIGYVVFNFQPLARIYFYIVVGYFLYRIIVVPFPEKTFEVLKACAYIVGAEVLFRMTSGAIFYEASKYLVIAFVLVGMFFRGVSGNGYPYFIYLIALVPSIIVASTNIGFDANFRTNIAFVLSGPVCLGVAALFFYDKKITQQQLLEAILFLSLPIISTTLYIYLYTPSLEAILTGTESNFATSGGFGPNQTSTILGLGMFAFMTRFFLKSPSLFLKILNIFIFSFISYRAIITFSRGGVFTAIIVIGAFLYILYSKSSYNIRNQILASFLLFIFAISITWVVSSNRTQGLIDKRYSNQDGLGREKEDISTGRLDLFVQELDGFVNNPFVGVGASLMKEKRIQLSGRGVVSHNELSRVLSEHGLIGIFILTILIIKPLAYRSQNKNNYFFYAFLCFWFATINHSAMRIAAPGFIYSLSLLNIVNEKNLVHRKRLIKKG